MAISRFSTRDTEIIFLGGGTRYSPMLALGLYFNILPPS